jgi:predicted nucleic acid-binding protein
MFANRYTVVLDACVLAPAANRNLVLSLAEAKFFRPRWSEKILSEAEGAIERMIQKRVPESTDASIRAAKAVADMKRAFPESCVDDAYKVYEGGVKLPDEGDRHVLAAAIHCRASTIVTDNLKHFPKEQLAPHNLEAKSADDFIAD